MQIENNENIENMTKDRFGLLFEDAKRRNKHLFKMSEIIPDSECTFAPKTINNEKNILKNSEGSFLERNAKEIEKKLHRAKSMQKYDNKSFTFTPTIGRAPIKERKNPNEEIWEYLNSKGKECEKMRESAHKRSQSIEKSKHIMKLEDTLSNEIIDKQVEAGLTKIFKMLDTDQSNEICVEKICVKSIFFVKKPEKIYQKKYKYQYY